MRECIWREKVKHLKATPSVSFPDIYRFSASEKHLLNLIKTNSVFGFVHCDVRQGLKSEIYDYHKFHFLTLTRTPPAVFEKIKDLNFPPVIHRAEINEDMLSDYMRERCEARNTKLPQETLIQSYNADDILVYTETARFYLEQARLKNY